MTTHEPSHSNFTIPRLTPSTRLFDLAFRSLVAAERYVAEGNIRLAVANLRRCRVRYQTACQVGAGYRSVHIAERYDRVRVTIEHTRDQLGDP